MTSLIARLALPALGLVAATGCSVDAAPAMLAYAPVEPASALQHVAAPDAPQCEIRVSAQGRMLLVESYVHADETVSGRATVEIRGIGRAGSTRIDQSAGFTAAPDAPALVSRSMVMGGASYDVSLSARIDGRDLACAERVGDST